MDKEFTTKLKDQDRRMKPVRIHYDYQNMSDEQLDEKLRKAIEWMKCKELKRWGL